MAADRLLGLICAGFAESHSRARVSASQCVKFCDDTPSVSTFPTLISQSICGLVFLFSELRHIVAQQCSVNGVPMIYLSDRPAAKKTDDVYQENAAHVEFRLD